MASKTLVPNNPKDKLFFAIMVVGIPFAVFWLGFVVMPQYHDSINTTVVIHVCAAAFIAYNIFGNMLRVIRTDASGRTSLLPSVLLKGWRYCHICNANYPPRSYHCFVCGDCILKRDHHCRFTGCCIGYHNQRYFLLGIAYIWLGSLYGVYYQWDFVYSTLGLSPFRFALALMAPHFAWLFGGTNWWGVIVTTLHTVALVTLVMVTIIIVNQLRAVMRGQTQHEMKHGIHDYDLSLIENVTDVLGTRFPLALISPHLSSPLKGDGVKFMHSHEYESPKNI